jgi:hypothetical protein
MARKRNPADLAVEFFQTADLSAAGAILDVCRGTIERRRRELAKSPAGVHAAAEGARRPARRSREVGPGEVSTPEGGAPGVDVTRNAGGGE